MCFFLNCSDCLGEGLQFNTVSTNKLCPFFNSLLLPFKMNMNEKLWFHFQTAQDITTINSFSLCIIVPVLV